MRVRSVLAAAGLATTLAVLGVVVGVVRSEVEPAPAPRPPAALPPPPTWVVDASATSQLPDVVGPDAAGGDTLARFGVAGTDLGHMFMVGNRIAIAFGDTWGGPPSPGGFYQVPHQDWRSNVLGFIDPPASPKDGLAIADMVTDRPGHAAELLDSLKQKGVEQTVIPTYGISVGRQMVLHYMSVRSFTKAGHWTLNYSGLAVSDDDGKTWDRPSAATWPGDTSFGQVAYVRPGGADDPKAPDPPWAPGVPRLSGDLWSLLPTGPYSRTLLEPRDDTTYVYGIPGGRYGDVSLAAVPSGQLLDRSAYRYWTGRSWSTDEKDAAPVVHGPVGELSVRYNSYYRLWMMMYLDNATGEILLRTSTSPTGPWGDPQVVTTTSDHPDAYAPYLTPRWNDGPDIWFTLSTYGDYRVSLMHARLRAQPPDQPVPPDVRAESSPGTQPTGHPA